MITQSATGMLKHVEFTLGLVLRTLFSASFATSTTGEISIGSQVPDRYTSGKCLFSSYRHAAQGAGNFISSPVATMHDAGLLLSVSPFILPSA